MKAKTWYLIVGHDQELRIAKRWNTARRTGERVIELTLRFETPPPIIEHIAIDVPLSDVTIDVIGMTGPDEPT